jgi:hypothetical protein
MERLLGMLARAYYIDAIDLPEACSKDIMLVPSEMKHRSPIGTIIETTSTCL